MYALNSMNETVPSPSVSNAANRALKSFWFIFETLPELTKFHSSSLSILPSIVPLSIFLNSSASASGVSSRSGPSSLIVSAIRLAKTAWFRSACSFIAFLWRKKSAKRRTAKHATTMPTMGPALTDASGSVYAVNAALVGQRGSISQNSSSVGQVSAKHDLVIGICGWSPGWMLNSTYCAWMASRKAWALGSFVNVIRLDATSVASVVFGGVM
mmetsp:Transcript_37767/g.81506  ORF Transcript_37767/g.81506 Transcript_37767/m.81506 type:complete len:213 (-) Transcript_37767:736-1374(-)